MSTVKVWTPEAPESPQEILRVNFDPRKHTRWEHRPKQVDEDFDWSVLAKEEVLTENQVTLLGRGVNSLLGLGRLFAGKAEDFPRALAARRDQLQAWAEARKEWPEVEAALADSPKAAAGESGGGTSSAETSMTGASATGGESTESSSTTDDDED